MFLSLLLLLDVSTAVQCVLQPTN